MAASVSFPGKSVKRVKRAPVSGFSMLAGASRRPSHQTSGSASARTAAAIGHPARCRDAAVVPPLMLGRDFVSHARWKPPQVQTQVAGVLVAVPRILRQSFGEDFVHLQRLCESDGGASLMIALIVSTFDLPRNGRAPASIS